MNNHHGLQRAIADARHAARWAWIYLIFTVTWTGALLYYLWR